MLNHNLNQRSRRRGLFCHRTKSSVVARVRALGGSRTVEGDRNAASMATMQYLSGPQWQHDLSYPEASVVGERSSADATMNYLVRANMLIWDALHLQHFSRKRSYGS